MHASRLLSSTNEQGLQRVHDDDVELSSSRSLEESKQEKTHDTRVVVVVVNNSSLLLDYTSSLLTVVANTKQRL